MGIHVGVNGTPKEVVGVYVGVNGTPKECSDIYVGVNGTPKSCYSGVKPGETIFTSSSTFTVPKGVKKIDVFCVGGGGGGTASSAYGEINADGKNIFYDESYYRVVNGGGGGGYTSTVLGAEVNPGDVIAVTVGAGGNGSAINNPNYWDDNKVPANKGGSSSVGNICSADGGKSHGSSISSASRYGCDGGSGGGSGLDHEHYTWGAYATNFAGCGPGYDGGNSDSELYCSSFVGDSSRPTGGKGQGSTTRYFGESNGTLYAEGGFSDFVNIGSPGFSRGGGGGGTSTRNGGTNTGGGGGAGCGIWTARSAEPYQVGNVFFKGTDGGSGICIIRCGDQKS